MLNQAASGEQQQKTEAQILKTEPKPKATDAKVDAEEFAEE